MHLTLFYLISLKSTGVLARYSATVSVPYSFYFHCTYSRNAICRKNRREWQTKENLDTRIGISAQLKKKEKFSELALLEVIS